MKETIINPAGAWSFWSEEKKAALKKDEFNTEVGDRIVYENDEFRIWSIHVPPGGWLHFHRHTRPYYWTVLTEGKARSYHHDGSVWDTQYTVGDTKYLKDLSEDNVFIHDVFNTGDTTLIFSTVELFRQPK